jgi:WD40 repeat protein
MAGFLPMVIQGPVLAGNPRSEPILRLASRIHIGEIWGIGATAAGRLLLTASKDKTARISSLDDGHLLRILRPPIAAAGSEGRRALARWRDCGSGRFDGVRLGRHRKHLPFRTSSGQLLRRLTGLPDAIFTLPFSHNGDYLAAGFGSGGIRVWRPTDWTTAWYDPLTKMLFMAARSVNLAN